jgi:bilirubin oxidase
MKHLFIIFAFCTSFAIAQNPLFIPDTLTGNTINLNLQSGTVNFYPGQPTATMGANGNLLGPTLLLNQNQNVTINVNNQLMDTTTIHWHGMHVAPENDGGPHTTIPPGTTWSPSFTVLDWASTYWYHPHLHMHTNEHVQKGIAGMVIVRDAQEAAITLPRKYGIDDFPIVIQTKSFDATNQIITIQTALDTALMVNGTLDPYLNTPAQVVRLRLLNGSSERVYNLGLTGNKTFYQIASDGGLLTSAVSLTRLQIAPGERAEILIDFSADLGQTINLISYGAELPNAIYGATQPGMGAGQVIPNYTSNPLNGSNFTVLAMNIVAATANPVTTIPTALVTHTPWLSTSAAITRSLTFAPVTMGPGAINGPFLINNTSFDMMMINYTIPFENIEIWQLTNASPISHPFHIHDVQFYVLDVNGVPPAPSVAGRKDVILVPAGNGVVRFITRFENFHNDTLPYMYHCHMLTHEDDGMMGQFIVSSPTGIDEQTSAAAMLVYPNPTTNYIQLNGEFDKANPFYLFDELGQVVKSGTLSNDNKVDLNGLAKGMYFLQIDGHLKKLKIVKQ